MNWTEDKESKKGLLFKREFRYFDASSRIRVHLGAKTEIPKKMFQPSGLGANKSYNRMIKPEGLTKKGSESLQRVALAKTTAKLTIGDRGEFYENRMQVFSRKIEWGHWIFTHSVLLN